MDSLLVWEGALLVPKQDGVLAGPSCGGKYVRDSHDIPRDREDKLKQDQYGVT